MRIVPRLRNPPDNRLRGGKSTEKPGRTVVLAEVGAGQASRRRSRKARRSISTKRSCRRSEKLGEEVVAADDKIERHLKSVFDHSVSKLAARRAKRLPHPRQTGRHRAEITMGIPSIAAVDVAALFGNPLSIRQAVIISEILNRPLERWDREASFDAVAWEHRKV